MGWVLLCLVLVIGTQAWLGLSVRRIDPRWGLATFIFGPFAAAYPAYQNRYHPELRVTLPFAINLASVLLLVFASYEYGQKLAADAARRAAFERAEAALSAPAVAPAASVAASAAAAAEPATPSTDPIDVFAAALRESSLTFSVSRLAELPKGVSEGAEFAVSSTTEGQATDTFVATVLRCPLPQACSKLGGRYALQRPRPRVVQNGEMLLVIPNDAKINPESMQGTVTSVFRHTGFKNGS